MQRSQIFVRNRVFCLPYPTCIQPALGGFLSEYRHPVWCGKTRMVWLFDGEKILKISLIVLTQLTHVTDRWTHRQTLSDTTWRRRPRLCIASRGKKLCCDLVCHFKILKVFCLLWYWARFHTGCSVYVVRQSYATLVLWMKSLGYLS